ncbi:tyrosine-type recombinase/integrase [Glaesserella parasuis]|uniref:tyrosine-type recombinase/integrase n=1 Tax=Glaesserella parasuis TaxID=738 RepID=UPI002436AEE4|nr:integrase arm-type DNA-binding domain-containing protein [Glaesserella parasuis]MDG6309837.1 tyrosine-type recombinase/integrase [Glaesserella parasuis]
MARIIQPLTNTQVEKAKYAQGGTNELNDGKGLFLQLFPTGAKKWRFRYNHPQTKARTKLTIGNYPAVSLAQARVKRDEFQALLAQQIDPQLHKTQQEQEEKLANSRTFQAVAEKWREKKQGEITEKTLNKYWRSLELHIFPFIGEYPINEIVPTLALIPLKRVEERNNIDMAQRLAMYINEILNFAVNGGILSFNPCLKMGKNLKRVKKKNNPHVKTEEIPQLLQDIENAKIQPQTRALVYFQLLTMVRPGEASEAEWVEFDLDKKLWTIPAERMKAGEPHIVPLSSQVIALLEQLQQITGRFKYVFPKRGHIHEPMSRDSARKALERMGYKERQTAHGLRGLARTYLAEQSITHEHAEACLAHKTGGNVSLAYNHATYIEQRKVIMQLWADFIEQARKP